MVKESFIQKVRKFVKELRYGTGNYGDGLDEEDLTDERLNELINEGYISAKCPFCNVLYQLNELREHYENEHHPSKQRIITSHDLEMENDENDITLDIAEIFGKDDDVDKDVDVDEVKDDDDVEDDDDVGDDDHDDADYDDDDDYDFDDD